jgi:hypothetical protein
LPGFLSFSWRCSAVDATEERCLADSILSGCLSQRNTIRNHLKRSLHIFFGPFMHSELIAKIRIKIG